MAGVRGDPNAREKILALLTTLGLRTRALIADHLEGRSLRRATAFFYAVKSIRETVDETPGDLGPKVVADLERLVGRCVGVLSKYRMNVEEAVTIARGPTIARIGRRCRHCGDSRPHEDLPCEGCGR